MSNIFSKKITTLKDAQLLVKEFAKRNKWEDFPNVDKFDHVHEELLEMSKHLRYKTREEREQLINDHKDIFLDGMGDVLFALCRLSNQLGIDMEEAFNMVKDNI